MQDIEILEKFEKLPIERRAAILRKYQEEIASKEDLSLQTLIDYLALNCVLANRTLPATWGSLLTYYYGVFYENNRFDIAFEHKRVAGAPYEVSDAFLHNVTINNKEKGEELFFADYCLSPLYSYHDDDNFCWRNGYTYKPDNPDDIAVVLPLSKLVVPSMISSHHDLIYISNDTFQSVYERTNEFLANNTNFYQEVLSPLVKTLKKGE